MPRFRGKNKFDYLEVTPGGVLTGYAPYTWGRGNVFYVDSRSWGIGNDSYPGTNPNEPLATIQAAYAKCTTAQNDYIILLDGYDNDTATITVAKTGLHFIGVNGMNHRAPFVWLKEAGTGAEPVFTLQGGNAANVEIAGFTLGADASTPCITTVTGASTELVYAWIHHVAFAASLDAAFVAQDGILVADGTGLDGTLVEDCTFGAQIGRDGIRFKNFYQGLIRNNLFTGVTGVGVDAIATGAATGMPDVISNKFRAASGAAEGWAISSNASGAGGGFIDDNHASSSFQTGGNNPYLDSGDANQWGVNWKWNAVAAPATT